MRWAVTVTYPAGMPTVIRFDDLDKALAWAKDVCQWMEISKAEKVTITYEGEPK